MLKQTESLRHHWAASSLGERFEIVIATALYLVLMLVACFALVRLVGALVTAILGPLHLLDLQGIQLIFGMVMTVLIALEFAHSLLRNLTDHRTIIHVREVILIGMMAIVRKLIILDLAETSAQQVLGLSGAIVALGVAYHFIGRSQPTESSTIGGAN